MKLEEVLPAHCHARAVRALAEIELVRDELGRAADTRPVPEITDAAPREVYFEALALWRKVDRLAAELGADAGAAPPTAPRLTELKPGHVLRVVDAAIARLAACKARLGISAKAPDGALDASIDPSRKPSDVLVAVVRASRQVSRALERPFTPDDVHGQVSLACAYAAAVLAARRAEAPAPAPFEGGRRPADCYQRLLGCLARVGARLEAVGQTSLTSRGDVPDVLPGDVFDLASLVVGEVAFLHALTPDAPPVHAFEPQAVGHRLPSHVHQLAGTLAGMLV